MSSPARKLTDAARATPADLTTPDPGNAPQDSGQDSGHRDPGDRDQGEHEHGGADPRCRRFAPLATWHGALEPDPLSEAAAPERTEPVGVQVEPERRSRPGRPRAGRRAQGDSSRDEPSNGATNHRSSKRLSNGQDSAATSSCREHRGSNGKGAAHAPIQERAASSRAGAYASADPAVRERARLAAREAREHRFALEQQAQVAMAARLGELLGRRPGSLAQLERRALRVLEIAATGELAVPGEVVQAARAALDHVRWRWEVRHGKPRQQLDVSARTPPVVVRDNVPAQLAAGHHQPHQPQDVVVEAVATVARSAGGEKTP